MKGTIELTGMEFHAFHGCLPEERLNGNLFLVDFSCNYDFTAAAHTDCLDDTIDYSRVYDIVAAQMEVPSNLLENVAMRIADAVRDEFPEVSGIRVKVSKQNPPVSGKAAWSSVTIED